MIPTASGSKAPGAGIACMLVSSALLTLNDAVLKWLTADYPVGQIMFLRGLFVFLPITLFAWRAGGWSALRMNDPRGPLLRAAFVVCATFVFVTSLRLMPLADAIAIGFAGPLFLTLLAIWFLKERVGWRRWCAVIFGFCGVLVIVRPTGEAIRWIALLPLFAAFIGALRDVVTRRIAGRESSTAILAVTTMAVTLAGLATAPFGWAPLDPFDLLYFAVSGFLLGSAHFLQIESFRLAEAGLVAPFKYSSMVWAVGFGFLIWGDLPDGWTVTGAVMVVASGLYILQRELRVGAKVKSSALRGGTGP